jgi:hypothetical protein
MNSLPLSTKKWEREEHRPSTALQVRTNQQGEAAMSFIDVAIPAVIGLVALARPQLMFYGSRAAPDEKKIRIIRMAGGLLMVVAAIYLAIKLVSV